MTDQRQPEAERFLAAIADFIRTPPPGNFLEFDGRWWTGEAVARAGHQLEVLLRTAAVPTDVAVGVLVRNRPGHAAAIIGLVGAGRSVVSLSTLLPDRMIAEDIERLRLGVIVAEAQDWSEALTRTLDDGRIGIAFPDGALTPVVVGQGDFRLEDPMRRTPLSVALLTSGTTGAPKRIELTAGALARGRDMLGCVDPALVGRQVEIHCHHFSSIGGMLPLLSYPAMRLPFSILEKFELNQWVAAVARNGSKAMGIAAPIVRTLLASDLPDTALETAEILYGGGGALEPEVVAACERRFGLQICWGYGATEFAGTLASWTRELRAKFGDEKAGSSGRPLPGVSARITDVETGERLPAGRSGRLEALIPAMNADWIKTNDLASLDEDGFLYILGRLDGAINRGGFKVLPDAVAGTLRRHPSVLEAAVFGIPDTRLGEVPVAAVELRGDGPVVTTEALRAFSREHLSVTAVPAEIRIYRKLPRTLSMKVDIPQLKRDWVADRP